jgi:hypothetical protein
MAAVIFIQAKVGGASEKKGIRAENVQSLSSPVDDA